MIPWFIATQPFTPDDGDRWIDYVKWSGLTQLQEVVSLDGMLCPTLLPEIKDEYWPDIVQEDFMLDYFLDFDYLMAQVAAVQNKNILCVFRNPVEAPQAPPVAQSAFSATIWWMFKTLPALLRTAAAFPTYSRILSF